MTHLIYNSFMAATVCYVVSLGFMVRHKKIPAGAFMTAGCIFNTFSLGLRYWTSFPLLPLYQGAYFLPCITGILCIKPLFSDSGAFLHPLLVSFLALAALVFPNDFYVPFLQSKTPFAHLFFIFGVTGKALFLITGVWALKALKGSAHSNSARIMGKSAMWGFFFWTLSVFSGAIWSYLGWGSPLIWDDPLLTTTMATWLYYTLFLHLHLTGFKRLKSRAIIAVMGSVWVFAFTCLPELGIFKWPGTPL